MKIIQWWKEPATINQSIAKGLVAGILIATPICALIGFIGDKLIEDRPSHVCAQTEVYGSSAWVACIDRIIQERK